MCWKKRRGREKLRWAWLGDGVAPCVWRLDPYSYSRILPMSTSTLPHPTYGYDGGLMLFNGWPD